MPFPPIPLAHAFGRRYDLPVPLTLFIVGGAVVVFVSFLLVLPRPVPAGAPARVATAPRRSTPVRRLLALLVLAALIAAGLAGSDEVAENILPTAFWLVVWIAIPISCGLLGDWTRPVNPFAALARLADDDRLRRALLGGPEPLAWPAWLAWWPATLLFFAAACGELIYNATLTRPSVTALALLVYALLSAFAGLLMGADAWLARGELFSVLWSTWGRLGWWRLGAPGRRGLLGGLEHGFEARISRITFVLLLLVSVSYDGLLSTPAWRSWKQQLPHALQPGTVEYLLMETAAFVVLILVAWALFGGFAAAVRRAGRLEADVPAVVAGLLPSLLPIAFGYLVAHNLEYLLINGQLLVPLAGDPLGRGWHLLPAPFNDSYEVNTNPIPSGVVWYFQVVLIIAVHICAVLLAHRYLARAARTERLAKRSEWPWIVAMVGYTMTSLWLLAQPLVQEGAKEGLAPGPPVASQTLRAHVIDAPLSRSYDFRGSPALFRGGSWSAWTRPDAVASVGRQSSCWPSSPSSCSAWRACPSTSGAPI